MLIKHIGSILLATTNSEPLHLNHVSHVPHITKNLLSILKLLANNPVMKRNKVIFFLAFRRSRWLSGIVEFVGNLCFIKTRSIEITLLEGVATRGLYRVKSFSSQFGATNSAFLSFVPLNSPKSLFACCSIFFFSRVSCYKFFQLK